MTMNHYGVVAIDYGTMSGCIWWNINHMMTDVTDVVWVSLSAPIGESDHSLLSAVNMNVQVTSCSKNVC